MASKKPNKNKEAISDFLKQSVEEEDSYFSKHYRPKMEVSQSPTLVETAVETRNKDVIKPEQSTNKPVIDTELKPVTEIKTRNKPVIAKTETRNVEVIKPEQSTNKPVTAFEGLSFEKVSSYQRRILQVIFQEVQANPFEKETRPLNIQQLGSILGVVDSKGFESLRIVILRLEKAGFLIKTKVKTGRSGWTQYGLPNQAFDQLLKLSQIEKPVIKPEQSTNKPVTKPVIDGPIKKEGYLNNNSYFLPEALTRIGLRDQMIKTERANLQELLNHLAYAVENKELKVNNPLGVVISIINNPEKNWVAGNLIAEENKILAEQEKRIAELKTIKEQQLRNAFEIYKMENPSFVQDVKKKNSFITTDLMAENIAFANWREEQGHNV